MVHRVVNISTLAGKRVLVTGGSGFLGSHLVQGLAQEGAIVGALARTEGKLALLNPHCAYSFLKCDVTKAKETVETIVSFAPHILFHFAASPDAPENFSQSQACIHGNLTGTLNTLEAFRLCGGELFVYGDSCKAYGNSEVPYRESMPVQPISSYAITKAAGWQFCDLYRKLHGMATVSVRPTLTYGPGQSHNLISFVVGCVLDCKREVRLAGGTQTRDPLFVSDTIEAFLATARLGTTVSGRVINIGGGSEISVAQLAAMILELMGSRLPIVSIQSGARPTEIWRNHCDNIEANEILGWWPRTDLRTGLRKTIQYLVESRAATANSA